MADYRSFTHVLRLGKPYTEDILNKPVRVFSKIDGTNACMYAHDGEVHYGSRKREVTCEDDNANFANYMSTTDDEEVAALRQYVLDHPNYIVYGEWLGGVDGMKFTGSLKGYTEGGFVIFAVFDIEKGDYLDYTYYYPVITQFYHKVVPQIAYIENPTQEKLEALLDKCDYLRPNGEPGEGIVIYRAGESLRDPYGNIVIVKIVRKEFLEGKGTKSKKNQAIIDGEVEREFVETYVTTADIAKVQAKIVVEQRADEWDSTNKKFVGLLMNGVLVDLIDEELADFLRQKRYKVAINFNTVRNIVNQKVRDYLGF